MTLRLAVLEHEPDTGLGSFGGSLDAANVEYEVLSTHRHLTAAVKALREGTPAREWGRLPMALARPSLDAHGK